MIKYDRLMMSMAELTAKESKCKRGNVGALLARDGRPINNGYNGTIAGIDNCCEQDCNVCNGTGMTSYIEKGVDEFSLDVEMNTECTRCQGSGRITNDFVVHAEQNLLMRCAKEGVPTNGTTLYVTMSPCKMCAKLIASAGIVRVVYKEVYRDSEGIDFLDSCGVIVDQFDTQEV